MQVESSAGSAGDDDRSLIREYASTDARTIDTI